MIDITCGNCNLVFQGHPIAVSQILRCPECGKCVIVPAYSSAEVTSRTQVQASNRPTWKWRDIIIGILLPIVLYGLIYIQYFSGFRITPWMSISWIIAVGLLPAGFALWIYHKRVGSFPIKRVIPKGFIKESLWAFLYVSLFWLIAFLIKLLLEFFLGIEDTTNWLGQYDFFRFNSIVYIAILIYAFTVVPFCEEVYFRGFFYNALKNRIHWIVAGIVQALFFAVLHQYNWFGFMHVFLAGLLLMFIYERRKKLLTPILAHAQLNFLNSMILLVIFAMNIHVPAQDWDEARTRPEWLPAEVPTYVEKMTSGEAQRLYAIETWGTQGWRLWKKEINAFNAVTTWFPEDEEACSKAKIGMVNLYLFHLKDYRRAVLEANDLLKNYMGDRETRASAWLYKAYGYFNLGDYEKSREAAETILSDYEECEYEKYEAESLLERFPQIDKDPALP